MARTFSPKSPSVLFASSPSRRPSLPAPTTAIPSLPPGRLADRRRSLAVVSASRCDGGGGGGFESSASSSSYSSLNAPLDPASFCGRSLSGVIQNDPSSFYDAVSIELNRLADDRDSAFACVDLSTGSPEASLYRRIAELKGEEGKIIIQDILYMMICYKFAEIRVPLVPSLDKCLYKGRLEILPSKDFELESIHNAEALEMVREYLATVLDWKAGSSVAVNWSPTQVKRHRLVEVYSSSIMYGYFLKSASVRHRLERHISESYLDIIPLGSWAHLFGSGCYGLKSIALGEFSIPRSTTLSQVSRAWGKKEPQPKQEKLRCYVQGFDAEMLKSCARIKSLEAANLVRNHCSALFQDENSCLLRGDGAIVTSLASLKRLVLEAIAFGCFLWDTEDFVDRAYKLTDSVLERRV